MKKQLLFEFKQLKKLKAFSLFALAFMATINMNAQTAITWTGGTSSDFRDANNWDLLAVPGSANDVKIAASSNNPQFGTGTALTISHLNGTSGYPLKISASLTVNGGSGNYLGGDLEVATGGSMNVRNSLYIGGTGNASVVNINGGTLNAKSYLFVSQNGACTLNINSGTVSLDQSTTAGTGVQIGIGNYTGNGTINLNGGILKTNLLAPVSTQLNITTKGLLKIDGGKLIMGGNQTTTINNYVTAGRIIPGAGKYIDATFDSVANVTNVTAVTPTWNGTAWSNITGPTASFDAIIDGTYSTTTNGAFTAKKLTVNSGKSLTINTGTAVTVQNEVISNGSTVIENDANLIQVLGTTNTNTGNVVVNRNSSPLLRLDYTLWSSPVASQNLAAFSPLTSQSPSRFYTYDTANNQYSNAFDPTTTNFAAATGYLIRMPNTADASTPTAYAGQFTGVPNNGDIPLALLTTGNGYNLVGNPYPSTINLFTLQSNNSTIIGNTFYMWRTTNAAGTAYCTYVPTTTTTGTYVSNGNTQSPVSFVGNIQPGQGFFVSALTTGPLVFKNAQRVTTAGSFFKTKQVAAADKVWLNATNTTGDFSQMAVTYFDGATQGVDAFDGKYINDSPLALTSNINNDEFTIQGRPAFDTTDVVPLNFKTAVAGDYTIAIDHSEGVFAAGQSVILTDATTGTETDLTTSSYTFTAPTGTTSSRFSLKYQKTLGTNKAIFNDNNVAVYRSKGTLYVNAGDATIANIKVYDVQGRLVAELKNVKATSATIANLKATNQVLVVKITSKDNKVVTKKVVN
jgi:hypothetical protein